MQDRVPTYPGRVQLTPVAGQENIYDVMRADEPTQVGDALNKANLLPDAVATALGLTGNPQVKDALARLSNAPNPLQYAWDKYQQVETLGGATAYDLSNDASSATTTYAVSYSSTIVVDGTNISLVNPTTFQISYNNASSYTNVLKGMYFTSQWTLDGVAKASSTATISTYRDGNNHYCTRITAQPVTATATYLGQVASYNQNDYPLNGIQSGYRYAYKGHPQYVDTQIITGSYTGTGTYGSNNKNSLTFSFVPKVLLVMSHNSSYFTTSMNTNTNFHWFIVFNGMKQIYSYNESYMTRFTWADKTVSWYGTNAEAQLNQSGVLYDYIAIC